MPVAVALRFRRLDTQLPANPNRLQLASIDLPAECGDRHIVL